LRKQLIYLFILVIACCSQAQAQHPFYYTVNDDNGLPSNEVYDLEQDEFGYMWIGCDAGLFRYDGFRFVQYKNAGQNSVAISGLRFSGHNKLYCQNFFGQIFFAQGDSLHLFADVKEQVRSHPEFTTDNKNNVWLAMPDGLLKYATNASKEYLFSHEISALEIESANDGSIYVLDRKRGLLRITENTAGKYTCLPVPGPEKVLENSRFTVKKSGEKLFVLSTQNVTHCHFITEIYEGKARLIKKIEAGTLAEFVYTIALMGEKLWLGTSNGAYCMNLGGEVESHYFSSEKVSDIFMDREGTYWFSSLQNGIFAIPHTELMLVNTGNSALNDDNITALKGKSPAEVYTGTYTGDIYIFDPQTKKLELLPKNKKDIYRNVTSIIPFDKNTVIAARGGLSVINTKTKKESYYHSVYIRDMAISGDSIVCVSTQNISSVNAINDLVSGGNYRTRTIQPVSGKKVCFDRSANILWAMLNDGLAILEGGNFRLFTIDGKPVFCNALYADTNGLWAGTVADGLYNIQHQKVALHLNRQTGLIGNNIKCITSQNDTLYVATDECINVRYPGGQFAYIKHANGINAKEINAISIVGRDIFIGTIRGMFYVPAGTIFRNTVPPNIRITSVLIDGAQRPFTRKIGLAHNNKDILINFSATALRSRGRFSYLYRIAGFQNEWKTQDGSINNVRLSHLPAGNYTFEVKALNEDGVESKIAGLALSVSAPFWQTWWFYLAIVLIASSVVTLLFLLHIRNIRRKADIRAQLTASQLTALKAQMNPHFMYNTLNSIQDLVLQNDIKNSNYYLSRYSSLMRKILDSSDHNEIDLAEEVEILQLYLELEQLRFGSDFTFSVTVATEIDKNATHIPSMVIQPFVENAIKHGLLHKKGAKHLAILFEQNGTILKCTITDNGVGRARAEEIKQRSPMKHKPFATRATEKRLSLINSDREAKILLTINDLYSDGVPAGTQVTLEIPVG